MEFIENLQIFGIIEISGRIAADAQVYPSVYGERAPATISVEAAVALRVLRGTHRNSRCAYRSVIFFYRLCICLHFRNETKVVLQFLIERYSVWLALQQSDKKSC